MNLRYRKILRCFHLIYNFIYLLIAYYLIYYLVSIIIMVIKSLEFEKNVGGE